MREPKGFSSPAPFPWCGKLLAAGLVDELRLLVHPVAARKGRKLVDDGNAPYPLKVTATKAFPTGVIRVIYSPTEAPAKVDYDDVKDQVPDGKSADAPARWVLRRARVWQIVAARRTV
jgi:hypothetical protein